MADDHQVAELERGERVTDSGIVIPRRNDGWPIVVLQTDVPQLQYNVAIDHEEDPRAVDALADQITQLQLSDARGDPLIVEELRNLALVDPHFGLPYRFTLRGLRSLLTVVPAYAQVVDIAASKRLKTTVHKQRDGRTLAEALREK